jgi:hypothetical protein
VVGYDGDGGDGGGGGDVVDGRRTGRGPAVGEYRGIGGSLWRIDGRGLEAVVVAVVGKGEVGGEVVGVLLIVVVGVVVVVVRRRGNSDLGNLLGHMAVIVVMRVDRIRCHRPY